MRHSYSPALVRGGKACSFALFVDENIERAKRQKVSFPKLDLRVVHETDCRRVPLNKRSSARKSKPPLRRTVVDCSAHQRVTLVNVVRLGGREDSPTVVEPVRPGQIGLLQVVVPGFELSIVD